LFLEQFRIDQAYTSLIFKDLVGPWPDQILAICVYNPPLSFIKEFVDPKSDKLLWRNKMGKGDQRTRRGKLFRGSHGKTRPGRNKKKKGSKKP